MKRALYMIFLLLVFCACRGREELRQQLDWAEQQTELQPDSACRVLADIPRKRLRTKELRARHALLYARALDKSGVDVDDDSLTYLATDYYLLHGTAHQKALACYYAGVVKCNGSNLESAVELLLSARSYLRNGGDFELQGLICSRLGELHERQYNYPEAVVMHDSAAYFYACSCNQFNRCRAMRSKALSLMALQRNEEALQLIDKTDSIASRIDLPELRLILYTDRVVASLALTSENREDAIASTLDRLSAFFGTHTRGEIPHYYYPFLGQLLMATGELDSARYYYKSYLAESSVESLPEAIYHRQLSELEWLDGNLTQALLSERQYADLLDTLYRAQQHKLIGELEQKYHLRYLRDSYGVLQERHRYMHYTYMLSFLLTSVLVLFVVRYIQRESARRKQKYEEAKFQYETLQDDYAQLAQELDLRDQTLNNLYTAVGGHISELHEFISISHKYARNHKRFHEDFINLTNLSTGKVTDFMKDIILMADISSRGVIHYLQQHYPALTIYELCHCSLILLGFNKESIRLLYNHQNVFSIYNLQSGIRHKIKSEAAHITSLDKTLYEIRRRFCTTSCYRQGSVRFDR